MPVIGLLHGGSPDAYALRIAAFVEGFKATGFVVGQNVSIEYRWANGQYDRLPEMAAELVHRPVSMIVAATPIAAMAAKKATGSIPIVFVLGSDPVKDGLVPNLNRPGGNITGATFFTNLLDKKRMDLVRQLFPNAKTVAILINPRNPEADLQTVDAEEAARSLGLELLILRASTSQEINELDLVAHKRPAAILIAGDAFLTDESNRIVEIATRNGIPTCFVGRWGSTVAGGLLSYGANLEITYRQTGNYAGRILKGERAGDLPVQQPTKFDLIINMKTAKALDITVPPSLLATADEVIE
jgi:putative ABC transport system substrate-binding protein